MSINKPECLAAALDPTDVARIARGLSRYTRQAQALGLCVFGGAGGGTLRFDDGGRGPLVVADLDGLFDGGDGATNEDAEGLIRGESA